MVPKIRQTPALASEYLHIEIIQRRSWELHSLAHAQKNFEATQMIKSMVQAEDSCNSLLHIIQHALSYLMLEAFK